MFSNRSEEKEIMDDLEASGDIIPQTLHELDLINRRLGGNQVTINGLKKILKDKQILKKLSIADIGCGGGDILKVIAEWARRKNLEVNLTGIDANPHIIEYARSNSRQYPELSFQAVNIFSEEFYQQQFDIITCSLFTHHFTDNELIALFQQLKNQVNIGMVINDLHRHWLAYYSIKVIVRLFSRSAMVKNDGPVSVLRAFSKQDLEKIMQKAGIKNYTISWKWAFRWQLIIWK